MITRVRYVALFNRGFNMLEEFEKLVKNKEITDSDIKDYLLENVNHVFAILLALYDMRITDAINIQRGWE